LPNIAYERIVNRDGRYTKKEETDMKILSKVRDNFIIQPWGVLKNYYIVNSNEKTIIEVHKEIIDIISKYREDI
jgi:thymidylate kinase